MLLHTDMPNVNLFSGKGSNFRAEIIYYLGIQGESSTWDISRHISRDEIRKGLSRESEIVKRHYAGVYRNIDERMLEEKYVEASGIRVSKGNDVSLYKLTFRGSLAVLALDISKGDIKKIIKKNSQTNPFFQLIINLEKNGIKRDLCHKLITKGIVDGVKENMINLVTDNESIIGQSIIPALMFHLSKIKKEVLHEMKNSLEKLLEQRFGNEINQFINYFFNMMYTPIFWKVWRTNYDAQLITLQIMLELTLNPEQYENVGNWNDVKQNKNSLLNSIPIKRNKLE